VTPQPIQLRGEPPPPPGDATIVVRAGTLDADRVRRTATACHDDFGFYGMSVFAALDTDVGGLFAEHVGNMQRYARYWTSTAGSLRDAGFPLFDSEDRPHFDVVLPDLNEGTVTRLLACFLGPVLKAKQP
jgi:hypothetical protein